MGFTWIDEMLEKKWNGLKNHKSKNWLFCLENVAKKYWKKLHIFEKLIGSAKDDCLNKAFTLF